MYESGFSIQNCADYFGITRQAMWKILKRRGVKLRSRLKFDRDNHFYRGGPLQSKRVHFLVTQAIQKGILIPKPCEICGFSGILPDGRNAVHGHHDDYNKPLEVRWLCKKHHHEWHAKNKAIKLVKSFPVMSRKQIGSLGGKAAWKKDREKHLNILDKARKKHWGNK
jgi:hypothetical protein